MRTTITILAIGLSAIAGASAARGSHSYSYHSSSHSSGSHRAYSPRIRTLGGSHRSYSFHSSYHSIRSHSHSSDYYTNVSGHRVHRPVFTSHAPRGASARCGDGSYIFSEHHQGTCSHHGGVSSWL